MSADRHKQVRPFRWGLLLMSDSATSDLPGEPPSGDQFATATPTSIDIAVRHAADVDLDSEPAEVSVELITGPPPSQDIDFRAQIEVPTGVLEIGDPETVERVVLEPGAYGVAARVSPAEHPDHVQVWMTRLL